MMTKGRLWRCGIAHEKNEVLALLLMRCLLIFSQLVQHESQEQSLQIS